MNTSRNTSSVFRAGGSINRSNSIAKFLSVVAQSSNDTNNNSNTNKNANNTNNTNNTNNNNNNSSSSSSNNSCCSSSNSSNISSPISRPVRRYRSKEFKDKLRMKFIDQVKKYIGVPYHARFHKPDSEIVNKSSLFLDCCGLIRQALVDLEAEFDFKIGKYNQSYLFDTLPIAISKKDLRPGDLIFYEGKYNKLVTGRSKPQLHDIVHVEVYLGDNETKDSTIGARLYNGVVSIFPTSEFKSNTWDLTALHYRSIETWLSGTCRSFCPEHTWMSDLSIEETSKRRFFFSGFCPVGRKDVI